MCLQLRKYTKKQSLKNLVKLKMQIYFLVIQALEQIEIQIKMVKFQIQELKVFWLFYSHLNKYDQLHMPISLRIWQF